MNKKISILGTALLAACAAGAQAFSPLYRPQTTKAERIGTPASVLNGKHKGLVVLVEFADLDFKTANPIKAFSDLLNKEGYDENGAPGSVHDYFYSMSDGQFDISFDVKGPVKLPNNVAYYGADTGNGSHDDHEHINEMVRYAMTQVDGDVDFSEYDWDGDGEAEHVQLVFAGYSQAGGAPDYTIWAMETTLGNDAITLDGTRINTYACSPELFGNSGTEMSGLGTFCHEFSHCLGLPDLYDTSDSQAYGMGYWDVMSHGNYNGNGWVPCGYTGYERNFCGWHKYHELKEPCAVKDLAPLVKGGETYVYYNPDDRNEYYLIENRYQTGWDGGLRGSGLLITHVRYNEQDWRNNRVNTSALGKTGMSIVCADGSASLKTLADQMGDVFPYLGKDGTADSFEDSNISLRISDIKKHGRNISFSFNGGTDSWENTVSGISLLDAAEKPGATHYYNIYGYDMGCDFAKLPKGIYILNGKKMAKE